MLNEAKIRSLKPKKSRYLICDADGLYLAVYPSGLKAWFFRRQTTDGKEFKKKLGGYPEIKLYDARQPLKKTVNRIHT